MGCSDRFLVRMFTLLVFVSALAVSGCGSRLGTVSGKVTYKGAPIQMGVVTFVGKDGKTAYISVTLNTGSGDTTEQDAQDILDAAEPAAKAGLETAVGGYVGQKLSRPSTESSEAYWSWKRKTTSRVPKKKISAIRG